jgi:acetyl-CoA synthetase
LEATVATHGAEKGAAFISAREFLLENRSDYEAAYEGFSWPDLPEDFSWVEHYFDPMADGNDARALHLVEEDGTQTILTYGELAARSRQVANFLVDNGASRGDRVVVMFGNQVELWESMLAAMRIGVVVIPATTLLAGSDLADRFERGGASMVITNATGAASVDDLDDSITGSVTKIVPGGRDGWLSFEDAYSCSESFNAAETVLAADPLLEYFTSGTTSKPKLVRHSHVSYPVGHLSTMYWLGLQPGDVHWTLSSPGWAKHAWGCFFAPFNAEACVFVYNYERFVATEVLDVLVEHKVTTLCAPPTVWRFLIQEDISAYPVVLRELLSAGEPLNPEVIAQVEQAWGATIRDGFGQTETTAQIANPPGSPIKPGSMGRPMPGYPIVLLDPDDAPGDEGEIAVVLEPVRPMPVMDCYADDVDKTDEVTRNGHYRTGDVATRDEDGYITYVGRADDVFKASGYRISPFELESALVEHPAVAEAAVVPSPDELRGFVPKAFVIVAPGYDETAETAADIFGFLRERVSGYKLVRRLEFADLPKTVSGKIRRVELRGMEADRPDGSPRTEAEFLEHELRPS